MSRFFKVLLTSIPSLRQAVMQALQQPNGRAEEPFRENGDFADGVHAFIALGPNHTSGEFLSLINQFITTSGVEEINEAAYRAAMPHTDEGL